MSNKETSESNKMDQKANAIRIRNNQRRSRAKHKELVNSLQQRLREYEAQSIQASAEMQRAARKVALENKRLRMLLQQKGVSSAEVDRYVSSFESGLQFEAPRDLVSRHRKSQNFALNEIYQKVVSHSPGSSENEGVPSNMDDGVVTLGSKNMTLGDTIAKSRCEGIESSTSPADSGFETSCEKAADIILQMRGDDDEQSVFSRLGCGRPGSCTMRNTTIFQLLDEI
ncbi:hypothetical protein EYR41_007678 [Orbilia oligospora]|uniref:Uncharacterized protein n=1 Tax=Orbilia oligospora TaxID=2813651 RepID=A0A7C8PKM1_ORBOL|nr:hypothetical protein TWF751_007057 [Orbilia oligospora]TGJ66016.1 hypothetical protein EYR41_007678 [Orbilia oligospora]